METPGRLAALGYTAAENPLVWQMNHKTKFDKER
jgi:hypothetical protein